MFLQDLNTCKSAKGGIHQSGSAVDSVEVPSIHLMKKHHCCMRTWLGSHHYLLMTMMVMIDISDSGNALVSNDDVSYSESDDAECERLSKKLHEWSQKFHVTQVILSELLYILRAEGFFDLTRVARSLLCTPRHVDTTFFVSTFSVFCILTIQQYFRW